MRPAVAAATPATERRSLPVVAGHERLAELAAEVKGCTRCVLHRERTQTVFARGNGASGVAFIGEGPGEEEDRQGEPFVGPAGQLLDRMIAAMQLARDDVYVCNIVKCRPPRNRKPEPDEMNQCRPFLEEQLELVQPRVIVALGATAVQGLLGTTEGITRLRGQWKLYRGRVPVMPTFHPAYLLRQPQAKREVWDDLREVLRHIGRPLQ
jgi:DNA polymerase